MFQHRLDQVKPVRGTRCHSHTSASAARLDFTPFRKIVQFDLSTKNNSDGVPASQRKVGRV